MKPQRELGIFGEHLQKKISRSLRKLKPERELKTQLTPEDIERILLQITTGLVILESVLSTLVESLMIITEEKED